MLILKNKYLFAVRLVNPFILNGPGLLDRLFPRGFPQQEQDGLLPYAYLETAVLKALLVGRRQIGVFTEVLIDLVGTLLDELPSSGAQAAAQGDEQQPGKWFQVHL